MSSMGSRELRKGYYVYFKILLQIHCLWTVLFSKAGIRVSHSVVSDSLQPHGL